MCNAHLPVEIYLLTKFHVDISYSFTALFWTKIFLKGRLFKNEAKQSYVVFFCTALLLNEIYLPTMFHVDISYNIRSMLRTNFKVFK
jgi:hypothetical protein